MSEVLTTKQLREIIHLAEEKGLFSWLPGNLDILQIAQKVLSALDAVQADGIIKPTQDLLVKVSPLSYGQWFTHQADINELGKILSAVSKNEGKQIPDFLIFHIYGSPELSDGELIITVVEKFTDNSDTTYLPRDNSIQGREANEICSPYLIDHMENIIPIKKMVFNIGRRSDNDLVIDDVRVSRQHAQIRLTPHGCILFDLESTGGTFINNQRIHESHLKPGDIVSIAGNVIVYNEDQTHDQNTSDNTTSLSQTHPPAIEDKDHLEFIG